MNRQDNWKVAIILVLAMAILMTGLWCIDIGVSAMNTGGVVTNGLFTWDPAVSYHFGMYFVFIAHATVSFVLIYCVFRRGD